MSDHEAPEDDEWARFVYKDGSSVEPGDCDDYHNKDNQTPSDLDYPKEESEVWPPR